VIRWLVASSIRFRGLVVVVAAATLVFGIVKLREAPVDVLPEYGAPTVEVQTEALGLSAAEVEQLITVPMEQDLLNGIAFLKDIRSQSVPVLSRTSTFSTISAMALPQNETAAPIQARRGDL